MEEAVLSGNEQINEVKSFSDKNLDIKVYIIKVVNTLDSDSWLREAEDIESSGKLFFRSK